MDLVVQELSEAAVLVIYIIICLIIFSAVYSVISFLIAIAACFIIGAVGLIVFELD
jgi:hypothetical protein